MIKNYLISSIAQKEMEGAVDWYEERVDGLGARFIAAIERSLISIRRNPKAFPEIKSKFRQFVVDDFPFVII